MQRNTNRFSAVVGLVALTVVAEAGADVLVNWWRRTASGRSPFGAGRWARRATRVRSAS